MDQLSLIALGSNMPSDAGAPEQTLRAALEAMRAGGLDIRATSRFYRTPCFPPGAGPDYVNAAIAVAGGPGPRAMLERLHAIEAAFGRARQHRWGMRTLDLDLIAVDDQVLPDLATYERWRALDADAQRRTAPEALILPHPRLQDRAFVLVPLAEVAGGWIHPVLGKSVAQMRDALPMADLAAVVALE
ncbi:2-amino-4-hydroxy-6-hydroxymethyldihydropteridine diphosphokinase [Sediminimonas sp.]|uniref:2-amino-4-hydroxy-6- hydroxymethyldihydropteridine diphosphokinase n=1 Tax=Sediminimonas sp. TaxID=2823379 RepID=UPI0025E1BA19|nr:2-amino-4-hydroxy-6-hydroxymethyldihydropteridine diphosphokinase [Sediminimonas sp.]